MLYTGSCQPRHLRKARTETLESIGDKVEVPVRRIKIGIQGWIQSIAIPIRSVHLRTK